MCPWKDQLGKVVFWLKGGGGRGGYCWVVVFYVMFVESERTWM